MQETLPNSLDSLWNPMDAAGSEQAFQALLPAAQQEVEDDPARVVQLLTWITRCQGARGDLASAKASLIAAQTLLEARAEDCSVNVRIAYLLEKGRLCVLEKTPSQARAMFVEAWTLAETAREDDFMVEVACMMAIIEPQKVQQDWIRKAIEIAERSKQDKARRRLGLLYSSLAWKHYDLRSYDKALAGFQRALDDLMIHGTPREVFVVRWSIGKVLRAMGRAEEALAVQQTLLAGTQKEGAPDGRLFEELAECLQALKRSAEAQVYFEQAYHVLSKEEWVADNQAGLLKRLKEMGKTK